ncbi:hypothetical protein V5799_000364 [Amblyomma americanum]|uniref:Uncharacterized protein n=1 Tax=Amblyomma americanum TaxID=6943 RepID=A0AAQ4D393_AMBAM
MSVIKQEESKATVHDLNHVDITSSEDDEVDEAEDELPAGEDDDKSSQLDTCLDPDKDGGGANDELSYKSADSVFRYRSFWGDREEVLELRASILVLMRRLLEAETQLTNQRRKVEVVRERILERELENLVSLRAPSQPDKQHN